MNATISRSAVLSCISFAYFVLVKNPEVVVRVILKLCNYEIGNVRPTIISYIFLRWDFYKK